MLQLCMTLREIDASGGGSSGRPSIRGAGCSGEPPGSSAATSGGIAPEPSSHAAARSATPAGRS
jgi:hypothetical protein